jgi:hypothetical protein
MFLSAHVKSFLDSMEPKIKRFVATLTASTIIKSTLYLRGDGILTVFI